MKHAAVAALIGSSATVIPGSVTKLWASEGKSGKQDQLIAALALALGDRVAGIEKNNAIAQRLAINLGTMRGAKPTLVARQQILLLAAEGVPRSHAFLPGTMARTVSQNLNDLMTLIRGQRVPSQLISSLLYAVSTSVLFSSHGIHFDDTRTAHSEFADAVLALKNRHSELTIGTRIRNKRRLLDAYRRVVLARARQVMLIGFPAAVTIQSAWVMTDYKMPRRNR